MASDTTAYFGFELLNALVDSQLTKKEDVIILFVHWYFIKNGFKCIGLGDSRSFNPAVDRGSELLPAEWNKQPNYSLRYIKEEKLYVLVALRSDDDLLLNFLKIEGNSVSNTQFPVETTVNSIHGPLESLIPNHQEVLSKFQKELLEPVYTHAAREIPIRTETSDTTERRQDRDDDDDPLRIGPPHRTPRQPWNPDADLRNIGSADLDPLHRGGGMIFDPFARQRDILHPLNPRLPGGLGVPGRLPPGAVPPGARFDPFGPPDLERPRLRPRDPDADHFPPPGYDDMFM